MNILSRLNDIFAANLTDAVDRVEDPPKMIRLAISEMEDAYIGVREKKARLQTNHDELSDQLAKVNALQQDLTEKAQFAVDKERTDLAKLALSEREKAVAVADQLREQIAKIDQSMMKANSTIDLLSAKLAEARLRHSCLISQGSAVQSHPQSGVSHRGPILDDTLARFDTLEQRIAFAEARAQSINPNSVQPSFNDEISDLILTEKIEAEITAMRSSKMSA